jgi:hypothetical protein
MTDWSDGMRSVQHELRRVKIAIQVSRTDSKLFVHRDASNGPPECRFTYVRLKGKNCDPRWQSSQHSCSRRYAGWAR